MTGETRRRPGPGPRLVAGLAAAVLAGASVVLVGPTPAVAAGGACSPSSVGVTVLVDFASFGGGAVVTCVPGKPANGLAALQANFEVAGTQNYGLLFVCRIDGKPTAPGELCDDTPPTDAHWSYWHAQPGGSWTFTSLGASSYHPNPGSVEGWAFGSGEPPSVAPPPLIPDPPPPPPPAASTTTASTTTASTTTASTANQPAGATETTADAGDTSTATSTTTSASAPRPSRPATTTAVAEPPASTPGFPYGAAAGIALVLVLGAAGGVTAWRRRHRPG